MNTSVPLKSYAFGTACLTHYPTRVNTYTSMTEKSYVIRQRMSCTPYVVTRVYTLDIEKYVHDRSMRKRLNLTAQTMFFTSIIRYQRTALQSHNFVNYLCKLLVLLHRGRILLEYPQKLPDYCAYCKFRILQHSKFSENIEITIVFT